MDLNRQVPLSQDNETQSDVEFFEIRNTPRDPCVESDDDSKEDENEDCESWSKKPPIEWDKDDTKKWLLSTTLKKLGGHYSDCCRSEKLVMPGEELLKLSENDFINFCGTNGSRLFELLPKQSVPTIRHEESVISTDYIKKRQPGRPRSLNTKLKPAANHKSEKLWEFVRNLLLNPEFCPQWIRWENYEKKRFRFVKSDCVAKKWGLRKDNPDMTYDNFSRAMRYYYDKDILVGHQSKRFVRQFGPKATGLETDDPNFKNAMTRKIKGKS